MAVWSCGFEAGYAQFYLDAGFSFSGSYSFNDTNAHKTLAGTGGSYCYYSDDSWYTPTFDYTTARWWNFWFKPGLANVSAQFNRSGTAQFCVNFTSDGFIQLRRGASLSTIVAYGTWNPHRAHWVSIELVAANTGGVCNVYVDGVLSATYSGDTQAHGSLGDWDQVGQSTANSFCYWDDLIVTTALEGRLDESYIGAMVPDGDAFVFLTPSTGTTHYVLVNTLPFSASTTSTYNEATSVPLRDEYNWASPAWTPSTGIYHNAAFWGYVSGDGVITSGRFYYNNGTFDQTETLSGAAAWDGVFMSKTTYGGSPINEVSTVTDYFRTDGDQTPGLPNGGLFEVRGSTGNDGQYIVSSANYDGDLDVTYIYPTTAVPDATADGTVYTPWVNNNLVNLYGGFGFV